jgi:hypothetical protein
MKIITATFPDAEAMHAALAALGRDATLAQKVEIVHPIADDPRAPTAPGSSIGGAVGAAAVATVSAIAVAATGGALLAAGPLIAAASGAAAGGMLGGVVGAVISGENNKVPDGEAHTAPQPMMLRLSVDGAEEIQARQVVADAGGVITEAETAIVSPVDPALDLALSSSVPR